MTKILKLRVINILSDELFCKTGLEHDFNCLIVKRIFDKEGALSGTTRRGCGFLWE